MIEDKDLHKAWLYENNNSNSEDQLASILPSYELYQSTISRALAETGITEPPTYIFSPVPSEVSNDLDSGYFGSTPSNLSYPTTPELADPTTNFIRWEDTILANTDRVKDLSNYDNEINKKLKIRIQLTEEIGKKGVKPNIIDPSTIILQQNQYIYGFVTIKNENKFNVPFDMFYVLFEGKISLERDIPSSKPFTFKLLNMFDFHASWSDGTINRLPDDNNIFYEPLKEEIDPIDNTVIQLNMHRVLLPGVTYKKFFAFKLPEKLLDYSCETHQFIKHLQIPPTMGKSQSEIISDIKRSRVFGENIVVERIVNPTDLSYINSTIGYSVVARMFGKAKDYNFIDNHTKNENELVILNEMHQFIKVFPHDHPLYLLNKKLIEEEAVLHNLKRINELDRIIGTFEALGNHFTSSDKLDDIQSNMIELDKLKNSYYENFESPKQDTYQVFASHKLKKNILKTILKGLITLSTPKTMYQVYCKPHNLIADLKPTDSCQVRIPLTLSYITKDVDLSTLKFTSKVELVATTIKSNKSIPTVFYPDMLFQNNSEINDNFGTITIKKFQDYEKKLMKIFKTSKSIAIDKTLINDVKILARLKVIYKKLMINDIKIMSNDNKQTSIDAIDWEIDSDKSDADGLKFTKKFDIVLNIANAVKEGQKNFKLTPDFQYCYLARLYHFTIILTCVNDDIKIKVPLRLQYEYPFMK